MKGGKLFMLNVIWDPTRELQRFQRDLDELFSGVSGTVHAFPPVNVFTNEDDAVITAELPGVEAGDIDITVHGDSITLSGKRKPLELKDNDAYIRRERILGDFSRNLQLPFRIDAEKVSAKFNKGVLSITLARAEADKPKKITIKAA
jgi:HSP20 family protein